MKMRCAVTRQHRKPKLFYESPVVSSIKGGFNSEGRGVVSQLPKMSAEKTILGLKNENADFFAFTARFNQLIDNAIRTYL